MPHGIDSIIDIANVENVVLQVCIMFLATVDISVCSNTNRFNIRPTIFQGAHRHLIAVEA